MVYDPCNSQIFTLGRYLDSTTRTQEYIKVRNTLLLSLYMGINIDSCGAYVSFFSQSDFYLYDTKAKMWTLICDDTSQEEGPNLIFDHQMCIDIAKRNIYVFGGRILLPRNIDVLPNDPVSFSGLFSYHIPTNTWTQILVDQAHPTASNPEVMSIKSRVTHCMLFHHVSLIGINQCEIFLFHICFFLMTIFSISVIENYTSSVVKEIKNIPLTSFHSMLIHTIFQW